jgi:hypothetical protein
LKAWNIPCFFTADSEKLTRKFFQQTDALDPAAVVLESESVIQDAGHIVMFRHDGYLRTLIQVRHVRPATGIHIRYALYLQAGGKKSLPRIKCLPFGEVIFLFREMEKTAVPCRDQRAAAPFGCCSLICGFIRQCGGGKKADKEKEKIARMKLVFFMPTLSLCTIGLKKHLRSSSVLRFLRHIRKLQMPDAAQCNTVCQKGEGESNQCGIEK